jgi:glycosyltransferase involved in cell wall biosynthesis
MTLLVLYEELATYFVKCISTFASQYKANVHIICKEVNKQAPFQLNLNNIKTYNRSEYTDKELLDLVRRIKPDGIFCGGWATRIYLKIATEYNGKLPTVIGFDNKWNGSFKQRVLSMIAPLFITNRFDNCFVPGPEQKKLALKMGFKERQIALGAYSCDFDFFYDQYLTNIESKRNIFPKRFIYVGRYVEHKGIKDLWHAFSELQMEEPNDWELWCLGTGNIEPYQHPKIKHFGFVQPENMDYYIKNTGVFVLPSHFEPWGVVIHEFCSAGFPIICSNMVGARATFVEERFNGYIYGSGNIIELKSILKKIINAPQEELIYLGNNSVLKAKQITPQIWSEKLLSLL